MLLRLASLAAFMAMPLLCADWSPRLAADYLDGRQKEWFAWPAANAHAAPCVSCHTGMAYLLARPALRRTLGEHERTSYETGLVESLRSRVGKTDVKELFGPKTSDAYGAQALGVEAIFAALFLATENAPGAPLSKAGEQAFDRMWALQIRDGKPQGAWGWYSLNLDPWEMPESAFYGATLAAMAVGAAPAEYRDRPDVREHVAALGAYLKATEPSQPLHNRLLVLWASAKMPGLVSENARRSIVSDIVKAQDADGGWSIQSLGQWKQHEAATPSTGSNAYATAFTACVLRQSGGAAPALARAQTWLKGRQDPRTGAWGAASMNKQYPVGSMQSHFMQDAATAFAAMALLD